MTYEHWHGPESDSLIDSGNPQKAYVTQGETLCCTIEADSFDSAMAKYHEHMGWEPYKMQDKIERANEEIRRREADGWRTWNDHPGYTIAYLNELLNPHGLYVETDDFGRGGKMWFRISKL